VVELATTTDNVRFVRWGRPWQFDTAAYWVAQAKMFRPVNNYRIGSNLREEVAACILGGFGLPALVGVRAFEAVRDAGLLVESQTVSSEEFERVLRVPLRAGNRLVRYRFPRQRSVRLAAALDRLRAATPPTSGRELRDWLIDLPGVGPKTASWIARNHTGTDSVAVIDIHVLRAGQRAGVFDAAWTPARDYARCEALFLAWARLGEVRASVLDACIWRQLSKSGSIQPSSAA
jgi:thermostable 8-oxoguanine DNA glycosylase